MIKLFLEYKRVRSFMIVQVFNIWLFQVVVFGCIFVQATEVYYRELDIPTQELAFARFIAGVMMHVKMLSEIKQGLQKMKYSMNHQWKFNYPWTAYIFGLFQVIMVACVTLLNYLVIILFSETVLDVAKDFMAMMIISEFDNLVYTEHNPKHLLKQILAEKDETFEPLFRIEKTTSRSCPTEENEPGKNLIEPHPMYDWVNQIFSDG